MRKTTLIILLLYGVMTAQAQTQEAKWGLGVYPSALSFYALDSTGVFDADNYEPGVRFAIARYLNASFDIGLDATLAIIRHPSGESNNENEKLWRDNFYDGNIFLKYKLNNGYLFGKKSFFAPYIKAGIGPNLYATDSLGVFAPFGAGLNIKISKSAYITAESNYKYGVNNSPNYLQHSIGVSINLGTTGRNIKLRKKPADADKDGVPDFTDKCPDLQGDALTGGCPDADNDGILDANDKCPNTKGYANLGGCLDRDNDGLSDVDDKCPDAYGESDSGGCPTGTTSVITASNDADGDNIPDELDRCPNEKGTFTATGCPDNDGDGIGNSDDTCPNEYGKVQYNGCPYDAVGMERLSKGFDPSKEPTKKVITKTVPSSTAPVVESPNLSIGSISRTEIVPAEFDYCAYIDEFKSELEQGILFDSGSAAIRSSTRKVLDRLAKFIKKCGQRSVIVKAHTDNVGDEANNQKLSERRAEAVKKYLIQKGTDANLLQAVGYGSMQPIVPNDTPENKAKNRRVELEIR